MMHKNILLSIMKEDHGKNVHRFLLLLTISLVCLNCCSLYLFLRGFLPLKTVTARYSSFGDVYNYSTALHHNNHVYKPTVDRLVLIIIDALRADFVPSVKPGFFHQASMPFTERLIQSGKALHFISKCHAPTVTLPRIKSILTGNIPSFADLIFNLNAPSLHQDNFISQAISQNKKIVFYGDDTWIKLLPNHFTRQDGTTSFFVSDYTEVDKNVTRHIDKELGLMDWDIMILHYLGIDHIGHLAGPVSSLLLPKLTELDGIVEKIYKGLSKAKRKTQLSDLVVITGDHGMSIGGSHGGVSAAEVLTPLIVFPTYTDQNFHMQSKEVLQIDIATTLSVLYGLPIPANNYGCVIKETMSMTKTPLQQQLFNLYYNSMQLSHHLSLIDYKMISDNHIIADGVKYHKKWLSLKNTSTSEASLLAHQIMEKYLNYIEIASKKLISITEKYDTSSMLIAIIISWQVVVSLFAYLILLSEGRNITVYWRNFSTVELMISTVLSSFILIYLYISSNSIVLQSLWTAILSTIVITYSNTMFIKSVTILKSTPLITSIMLSETNIFLILGTALYIISLLSSSYIEEEHQTWYFLTSSYYVLLLYTIKPSDKNSMSPKCTCQAFSFRPATEESTEQVLPVFTKCSTDFCDQKTFEFYAVFKSSKFFSILGLIVLGRILRSWNQTGNKWAHLPDVGDFLNLPEQKLLLTFTVVSAAIVIIILVAHEREALQSACLAICILNIYFYRVSTKQLVFFMNIEELDGASTIKTFYIWLTVVVLLRICIYFYKMCHKVSFDHTVVVDKFKLLVYFVQFWIIFSAALHRPHNIPLLAAVILQETLVSKVLENKSIETLAIVYSWMAMCSFFYQGNSNSLSTIDVSAGYLGLSSYHPILVGSLILCNTYSGILFWLLMLMLRVFQRIILLKCDCSVNEMEKLIRKCACTILCMRYLSFALYLIVMVLLRYHLFIWTVFTPKLLYEGAHNIIFSLFVLFALLFSSSPEP